MTMVHYRATYPLPSRCPNTIPNPPRNTIPNTMPNPLVPLPGLVCTATEFVFLVVVRGLLFNYCLRSREYLSGATPGVVVVCVLQVIHTQHTRTRTRTHITRQGTSAESIRHSGVQEAGAQGRGYRRLVPHAKALTPRSMATHHAILPHTTAIPKHMATHHALVPLWYLG